MVQEVTVEGGVVGDELGVAQKVQQGQGNLGVGEHRLVGEKGAREAMHPLGVRVDVAFRIDVAVEVAAGRQVVAQLHTGDLDDPVASLRLEAGGLGVEDDFARHLDVTSPASRAHARHP